MSTSANVRCCVAAFWLIAAGGTAAGPWTPAGPPDALDALVATHPTVNAHVVIVAGAEGRRTTYSTQNGGFSWESHARPRAGGLAFLSGMPTIVTLGDGALVQRSHDSGRSFFPIVLPTPPAGSSYALAGVNPSNSGELIAFAGATVSQSLDGGTTWTSDAAPAVVTALVVDWDTRRLYADFATGQPVGHRPLDSPGAWGVGGPNPTLLAAGHGVVLVSDSGGLLRSTDGGTVYNPVAQALGPLDACAFAFSRAPSTRVYALECTNGRLIRSDDDGATWAFAAIVPIEYDPRPSIAVDAGNPDRLYVATARGVFASNDGAVTMNILPRGTGAPGAARRLVLDRIDPARQWVAGVTTGYFRSTDGGANFGFIDSDLFPIAASRHRTATLFGIQSTFNFGNDFALSPDGGSSWTLKIDGPARDASWGPITYGAAAGELYLHVATGGAFGPPVRQVHRSIDDGETWALRFAPPVDVLAMAATPSGPTILYAGGGPLDLGAPQLYRSTDGAVTWQAVATFPAPLSPFGGAAGNTLSAFAIDPVNPSRLYAGFVFPDYLMRSEDGGATWTRITSGLGAGEITSIVVNPVDANTLYVSQFGSGVFRSTDRGGSWTAMDEGLGDEDVLVLEQDPFSTDRLHASTASGVYRTQLGTGIPAGSRRAVEFYHAQFNHYFVSADNDEVAGLDAGVFQGWSRTGEAFRVTEFNSPGSSPVCRFFSVGFSPLSTHFYTPYSQECEGLKSNPAWLYERIAFGLMLPDAPPTRGCRAGTRALYRLWNRNLDGAPNHRYTTNPVTFDGMQGQGWAYEGEFPTLVFACVPY